MCIHPGADVHTLRSLTGISVNKTFEKLATWPEDRQRLVLTEALQQCETGRTKTKDHVTACDAGKLKRFLEKQTAMWERLERKTKTWLQTESVVLLTSEAAVQRYWANSSSDRAFIHGIKEQCRHLMSHFGVKKAQLFTYTAKGETRQRNAQ